MGSEDLFHKRKARKSKELVRPKGNRKQNDRYLIVCEGKKTEPQYFREMLLDWGINPKIVRVAENDGNSPDRIVEHSRKLYEEESQKGDPYDKVFCVFDRDNHTTFDAAVQRIADLKNAKRSKPFEAITSNPCFEFWLLLHFGYRDTSFHSAGKKSVGDQAVAALKKMPGFQSYDKGQQDIYHKTKNKLSDALQAAKQLRANSAKNKSTNPATEIDRLVLAIQSLIKN